MEVQPGIYKHYKGNYYVVLGTARNSEDANEISVIYMGLYDHPEFGENQIWYRPIKSFTEMVIIDGKTVPRFEFIKKGLESKI